MRSIRREKIAGVKELGMPGRGEHAEITSYLNGAVESELSGNMIDICPVGALTSKPFRYTARSWELEKIRAVRLSRRYRSKSQRSMHKKYCQKGRAVC